MFSFNSIRTKLMVPTLLLALLLLSFLGMLLAMNSHNDIELMLTAKANATVDFISKVSTSSYKNYEYFDLDNFVLELKKDPEVDFAVFYDANGGALTKETGKSATTYIVVERNIADEKGTKLGLLKIGFNRSMLDSNLRHSLMIIGLSIAGALLLFVIGMKILCEKIVIRRLEEMEALSERLAEGDMSIMINVSGHDEIASLGSTMNKMAANLKELIGKTQSRNSELEEWKRNELRFKSGLNDLNIILRGEQKIAELADKALVFMTTFLGAGVGIVYQYDEEKRMLDIIATYAISKSTRLNSGGRLGEGLVGQVALERKPLYLKSVQPDYLPISSALGKADPLNVAILPIMHNDSLVGVLELGSFRQFGGDDIEFLNQSLEGIAIAIRVSRSRQMVNELLEQTQLQAEELRVQQEELQQTNEELGERARMLAEQRRNNKAEMA